MLDPLYDAIGWLLSLFYSVVPNLGVAIILLTFTVMLILYPLTAKQAKSMMAMQRLQPEIKKLQAKYKGDRQKLNEEMMKLYQEAKVNPLAGCLPLLAQMPIFISLFGVLRDPQKYVPRTGSLSGLRDALCAGFGDFVGRCGDTVGRTLAQAFPEFERGDKFVNHLEFLGIDLQLTATDPHGGFFDALPYFLLVVLVMLTGYLQSRQAQKRTPVTNKGMGTLMKVLPVFFGLISLNFPAGLVLYFFVSNLWRLGQQEVIFSRHGSALHGPGGKALEAKSSVRPSKAAPPEEIEASVAEPAPEHSDGNRSGPAPDRAPAAAGPKASGLRGMLSMSAPPASGPTGRGPSGPTSPAPSSESTGGNRSSTPRRRNKKKRKR
ncbi:MAG: YidC/Oxa1 family membrane protein insertase [Actinobacteria bacterium]|nr:YidC/Oxa1 family membrane protein insertase [Actinomycetota bacterium]